MFNYDTRKFSVEPRVRGKFEAEASDKAYALFTNRSTAVAKDAFAAADKLRALIEGGTATAEELRAAAEEASAAAKSGRKASDAAAKSFLSEHKDWRRVRPRRARRGANGLRYSMEEAFPATEAERAEIERAANANGTWLKAPNGNPSELTPEQWVTVRTRAFKEWFGDWEKAARIEKLRDSVPVEISGREIEEGADIKSYRKNAKEYGSRLRGTYLNRDTGKRIAISMGGINEVLSHDASPSQFKSIAAIPQMVENGIYIESRENEDIKKHPDVGSYDYFVCGLKIGGVDYTAKIVVANQRNGERYYDHKLTQIEKGALLSTLSAIHKAGEESNTPLSEVKDKRLLSILQANSSKIVDENGEPLVVYHGTDADFTVFDRAKARATMDIQGNFFSPWEDDARGYGSNVRRFFLNLRNPADENTGYHSLHEFEGQNGAGVKARERLVALGYDGVNNGGEEFIAFSPEQIKSATENVGTFDAGNPDIRYSLGHGYMRDGRWSVNAEEAMSEGRFPAKHIAWLLDISPEVVENTLPWEGEFHHMGEDFKKVHFYSMPNAAERIMLKYFVPRIREKNRGGIQSFNNHRDKVARQFGVYDYVGIAKQRMSAEEEAALDLEAFEKAYAEAAEKDRAERDAEMREMSEKYGVEMEEVPQPLDYDYEYDFHDDEGMIRYSLGGGTSTIRAWHGSPHEFDAEEGAPFGRFGLSFVGTGEGGQAFGYGIYISEVEGVAEGYAKRLGDNAKSADAVKISKEYGSNVDRFFEKYDLHSRGTWLDRFEPFMLFNGVTTSRKLSKAIAIGKKRYRENAEVISELDKISPSKEMLDEYYIALFSDAMPLGGNTGLSDDKFEDYKKRLLYEYEASESKPEYYTEEEIKEIEQRIEEADALYAKAEKLAKSKFATKKKYHHLYSVELSIASDESNLLDWIDKPSEEQLERIRRGLEARGLGEDAIQRILDESDFEGVYHRLDRSLGGDREASLFLKGLGFVGHKYPVGSFGNGRRDYDDGTNYVIYDTGATEITDAVRWIRDDSGVVYGYWDEGSGELHLNEDFADFDTPLHEWAHVWLSWVRKADARLAERALAVTKETRFYKRLREDKGSAYAGLSDDALAEERGACRISSEAGFQFSPGQTAKKCPL